MNKKLYRDGPYEDFFSQGVLVGNILTLAGQIGVDECMNNVSEIFAEREKIYGCKPEVSQTLVGTSALVQPDLKIEIKCIAYVD